MWFTVKGVVTDPIFATSTDHSVAYVPLASNMAPNVLLVRSRRGTGELLRSLTRIVAESDDGIVITRATRLETLEHEAKYPVRMSVAVFTLTGVMVMLLTVSSLYTIVSRSITARSLEFAIRSALGATPSDLRTMAGRFGVTIAALGLGAGSVTAAFSLFLSNSLIAIGGEVTVAVVSMLALCALAIMLAAFLPSRRHWSGADAFEQLNRSR
jgi:ABC-type antimicrobial peptide transport system permease subunit